MDNKKKGFIIFCLALVVMAALCVAGYLLTGPDELEPQKIPELVGKVDVEIKEPATHRLRQTIEAPALPPVDNTAKVESIKEGAVPTQEVGERGSLEGAVVTDYPMKYPETQYERLPDSPLIKFTDEMIWQDGSENDFKVKRDAIQDQANTIQEASIALSVSPRVEMGKVLGYRLVEIPADTLFSKMGLVSGDIVLSINGRMPDMEPMALMFVNMTAGKQGASTIEVEHRGVKRTIRLRASE